MLLSWIMKRFSSSLFFSCFSLLLCCLSRYVAMRLEVTIYTPIELQIRSLYKFFTLRLENPQNACPHKLLLVHAYLLIKLLLNL